MKGLEERLYDALRPVEAPDGLTDAVMARLSVKVTTRKPAGQTQRPRPPVPWWKLALTPASAAACLGLVLLGIFISVAEAAAGGAVTPVSGHLARELTGVGTTVQVWVVNLQLHFMQIVTRLSGV